MASSDVSEDDLPPEEEEDQEGYEQREGTVNFGGDYEYLIPTLFALRCIFRKDIKNIWLACNVEGLGAFDDVFLNVEYENGKQRLYVIQLKHVRGPIENRSFTDKKRKDFNVQKYYESYQKIEKSCGSSDHALANVRLEDITFILYTTADLQQPSADKVTVEKLNLTLEKYTKFEENLINTKGRVYKFNPKEENCTNAKFLSQFYLFTKQSDVDGVQQLIYETINANFAHIDNNIKKNFIEYMKIATTRGKLRKLQKSELQAQLAELVLTSYVVEPDTSVSLGQSEVWNKLIKGIDVVVLKEGASIEAKIWSCINIIVKIHTGITIPASSSWLEPVGSKFKIQECKNQRLVSLIKQTSNELTFKSLYISLWETGLVPLFLKANSDVIKRNIALAIKLIKTKKTNKHFTIIADDFELQVKDLKIFRNIQDLPDEKIKNLPEVPICLQGRHLNITLSEIMKHKVIEKFISSELLLEMLHETLIIGKRFERLPEYYVKRRVAKPGVHVSVLEKLNQSAFVIVGSDQALKKFKTSPNCLPYSKLKPENFHDMVNVITTSSADGKIFEKICNFIREASNKQNVHKFKIHEESDYLEWLESSGSAEELRRFLNYTNFMLPESDMFNLINTTNIICANPGMGKTIMTNYLALNYPSDYWVVKINLTAHAKNFSDMTSYENIFDYFHNMTCSKDDTLVLAQFTKTLFEALVKKKKVCIICDGFDEASYLYFDKVSQLLKHLSQEGYHLWIMGRPVVHHHLEALFNILSIDLQPLSADDQLTFLKEYYKHEMATESPEFITSIQQIIENSFSSWKNDFPSVPLHIRMIAEIFIHEDSTLQKQITLIDLYEKFIDNKLNIYWKKMGGDYRNAQFLSFMKTHNSKLKSQHVTAALTLFYPKELLQSVVHYKDLEDFLQEIKIGGCNIGIITGVNEKLEPIFEHRSFAEYLTAKWLSQNCKREFVENIFKREHREVRRFFDRMMAVDSVLHSAVLNCDLQKVDELITTYARSVDKGGRTVLHLSASWSLEHVYPDAAEDKILNTQDHYVEPLAPNHKEILSKCLNAGLSPSQKDTLLEWTALDYADKTRCLDAVEQLIDKFDYDSTSLSIFSHKSSLLYFCAKYAYVNIFKNIKAEHPIVRIEGDQTLVHVAAQNGSADILEFMLNEHPGTYKELFGAEDKRKRTPLLYACRGPLNSEEPLENADYNGCIKMLLDEHGDVNTHDEDGYSAVHAASEDDNEGLLKDLIRLGADVNRLARNQTTALQVAASQGHFGCLVELIKNNADVNVSNDRGYTALSIAACKGHVQCVEKLVENNADVNASSKDGYTPLGFAAHHGYLEILKVLLKHNVDLNACTVGQTTPLLLVILFKHSKACAQALVDAGADVNFGGTKSLTPLYAAASTGNKNLIRILLKAKVDVNKAKDTLFTPLHVAARQGYEDIVELLLKFGAQANAESFEGITPLIESAREGHLGILKRLIKWGASINHATKNGNTALHAAVDKAHFGCARLLIKNKANVNAQAKDGATPFNTAVSNGNRKMMEILLKAKVNLNCFTAADTALHVACFYKQIDSIKFLIENGALVNVANDNGITPLHIAAKESFPDAIDILIKAGACPNQLTNFGFSPMALAVYGGNPDCIERLLLNGANIFQKDNVDGTCMLFSAVANGNNKIAELLIEKGISVNHCSNDNFTPLVPAVLNNRIDFVRLLVEHGADVNAVFPPDKVSALQRAVFVGSAEIVKYLVDHGADVNQGCITGKTALDMATQIYSHDEEILYYLNQSLNK